MSVHRFSGPWSIPNQDDQSSTGAKPEEAFNYASQPFDGMPPPSFFPPYTNEATNTIGHWTPNSGPLGTFNPSSGYQPTTQSYFGSYQSQASYQGFNLTAAQASHGAHLNPSFGPQQTTFTGYHAQGGSQRSISLAERFAVAADSLERLTSLLPTTSSTSQAAAVPAIEFHEQHKHCFQSALDLATMRRVSQRMEEREAVVTQTCERRYRDEVDKYNGRRANLAESIYRPLIVATQKASSYKQKEQDQHGFSDDETWQEQGSTVEGDRTAEIDLANRLGTLYDQNKLPRPPVITSNPGTEEFTIGFEDALWDAHIANSSFEGNRSVLKAVTDELDPASTAQQLKAVWDSMEADHNAVQTQVKEHFQSSGQAMVLDYSQN
ncbi:hypothetical protein I317_03372 [Kwoniella heveanensis CBS 569]|nr:hypothetical protein I317_03372 [Kwoniella heveanensis CBS 569]